MEAASRRNPADLLVKRQAAFARMAGVTARQVNTGCRGRARAPRWAMILAAVLQKLSPDALAMMLEAALRSPALPARLDQDAGPRPPQEAGQRPVMQAGRGPRLQVQGAARTEAPGRQPPAPGSPSCLG